MKTKSTTEPICNPNIKGQVCFLHIKPYNKDIYDHIQCSTAL